MSGSEPAQGQPATASVYDFLYYDARRVGSFLAQFDENGLLQSLKRSIATAAIQANELTMGGDAGLPVIKARAGSRDANTEERRDQAERVYDPLWANALGLMDLLDERRLIRHDLGGAAIGDFVLISGGLVIFDVAMLREVWKRPTVQKVLRASAAGAASPLNRHEKRREGKHRTTNTPSEVDLAIDLIGLLPHTIQGWLLQPASETWFTLREDSLTIPAGEIILKYGAHLGRRWHVLGVLDARPGSIDEDTISDLARVMGASQLGSVITELSFPTRVLMGRSDNAFAVTPLLIFREAGGGTR